MSVEQESARDEAFGEVFAAKLPREAPMHQPSIGDCVSPHMTLEAAFEGHEVARRL